MIRKRKEDQDILEKKRKEEISLKSKKDAGIKEDQISVASIASKSFWLVSRIEAKLKMENTTLFGSSNTSIRCRARCFQWYGQLTWDRDQAHPQAYGSDENLVVSCEYETRRHNLVTHVSSDWFG